MNKRITIKDIARELDIHHSTVSRALRNDPRVNIKTRDLILDYAQIHDYQININALQLRGSGNNAIALIVPNINHSFFSDVISILSDIACKKGYVISVFQTNEQYELEVEIVNTIIRHDFAGVLVSIAQSTLDAGHFRLLHKFGIPIVFFDRVCEDISTPKVLINNEEITAKATEYLISKNYERIVHITGNAHINVFRERQAGYLKSIENHGLKYTNSIILNNDFTVDRGKQIMDNLFNSPEKPDAIISSSIHITMGILLKARELKINIPDELGIVSFGTQLIANLIQPGLISIEQPEKEIAKLSFQLLEQLINKEFAIDCNLTLVANASIHFHESC